MDFPGVGFVLGAGLGTRLGILSERRPKPLIPVFNKPLIAHAFERLEELGIRRIVVNTHHCAGEYAKVFPAVNEGYSPFGSARIIFRHEPLLLDTAGGVRNIRELLNGKSFLVYNGDILSDLPMRPAIDRHFREGNLATLILRSSGGPLQVQVDPATGLVCDIGGRIGGFDEPKYLFTGIYLLDPEIHALIPEGQPLSITPLLVEQIRLGRRVAGVIIDEGKWWDLGNRHAYLDVHKALFSEKRESPPLRLGPAIHPTARIAPNASLSGFYSIGAHAVIEDGAVVEDSVVWENARIRPGTVLRRCIVREGCVIDGEAADRDF